MFKKKKQRLYPAGGPRWQHRSLRVVAGVVNKWVFDLRLRIVHEYTESSLRIVFRRRF